MDAFFTTTDYDDYDHYLDAHQPADAHLLEDVLQTHLVEDRVNVWTSLPTIGGII